VTTTNPYTVVFTTGTLIHAVKFDTNSNTFTKLWDSATYTSPSAPVVYNFGKVYVGTGSDIIYELDLSSGNVTGQRVVDTGNNPMFIGEPSLDLELNRIYVTTTTNDQRSYAYTIPF
jgi:outer membrane protein assembly factor BamB